MLQLTGSTNILYFDMHKQSIITKNDIYENLSVEVIRKASIENHQQNSLQYVDRPDLYMSVIRNIVPIPKNSNWSYHNGQFIQKSHKASVDFKQYQNLTAESFKEKLFDNLEVYKGETIGIELSGGLDSSITLSLLENSNIDLFLIGIQHHKYEYRSEIKIQNIYAQKYPNHLFLTGTSCLPYQNLLNAPIHPLPSTISLFHDSHQALINEFKKRNCKRVFSGHGGDAIFILEIGSDPEKTYNQHFQPWMLDDGWIDEFIYQPNSISYQSVYNLPGLSEMISFCRKNERDDVRKEWARKFFSQYLPNELVNYQYKTANDGIYYDGLELAIPELLEVFKCAYEVTKNEKLKPSIMEEVILKHLSHKARNFSLILSYASYAVWIHSLIKHKII
jgi:asparagine synthetase B (glutamine-hydrolysing)